MNRSKSRKSKTQQLPLFINKLLEMVEDQAIQPIIGWTSTGDSFNIKSVTKFTEDVLPKYFKHKNFSSFIRQLNMYGFRKIRHQEGENVYMNDHFRMGSRHQLRNISRRIREEREDRLALYNSSKRVKSQSRELFELKTNQKNLEQCFKHMIIQNQRLMQQNQNLAKKIENGSRQKERRMEEMLLMLMTQMHGKELANGNGQLLQICYDKQSNSGREEMTPLQAIGNHLQRTQSYQKVSNIMQNFYGRRNAHNIKQSAGQMVHHNEQMRMGNCQSIQKGINLEPEEDEYLSIHNFLDADEFQNEIHLEQSR